MKGLYSIIKKTKEGSKNWADINTENYLKKKNSIQDIDTDKDRQKLREYSKKKYYSMSEDDRHKNETIYERIHEGI